MNTNRPNFNNHITAASIVNTVNNEANKETQNKPIKLECGAAWIRRSKNSGMDYMTARFKFTKADLQSLLESPEDQDGYHIADLVAFKNKTYEEGSNKPFWRFYTDNKSK